MTTQKFRYYVLLADMRTGSNLFENVISQYEKFICLSELFNPHFIGQPDKPTLTDISIEERDADPIGAIEKTIKSYPDQLIGFRLFSDHNATVLEHCLADPDCAKIILRRNPMDSFVSLKIAQQTKQWFLKNAHGRRDAKVDFDFDEFQIYLGSKLAYRKYIDTKIHDSGQTAFRIDYDDMERLETFNGVAKFLGSVQQLPELKSRTKKQNPGLLQDKVKNYDQMREQVRDLNIFESDDETFIEPSKTKASMSIFAGRSTPIMYFPVVKNPNDPTLSWLRSLEPDGQMLRSKMASAEVKDWLAKTQDRVVITALEHPVERAYRAFNTLIAFPRNNTRSGLRRTMTERFEMDLLDCEGISKVAKADLDQQGYTAEQHKENFLKFIKFLTGNLRGQTTMPIQEIWGSQFLQVQAFQNWTVPNFIIMPTDQKWIFSMLEQRYRLSPQADVKTKEALDLIPLGDIYCHRVEQKTKVAYFMDYRKLGFQPWKPKV